MNRKIRNGIFIALCFVPAACGLTQQDAKNVTNDALNAEQIACILATELTDDATLASVCNIADNLRPLIKDLVGKRPGILAKAKAAWKPDASADAR